MRSPRFAFAELGGQLVRMSGGKHAPDVAGQFLHLLEAGPPPQRRPYVDALRARDLRERREAELAHQLAGPARGAADRGEVAARWRIQVDHEPVGLPDAVRAESQTCGVIVFWPTR